jgi:predicted Zn-dependent protease
LAKLLLNRKSKLLVTGAILIFLAAGGVALRGPFAAWQKRRLTATAQAQLGKGDFHSASLGARALLQVDPRSIAACEILARVAEEERSPMAVIWREKLVQLQPGKAAPLIDLARTATESGETFIAEAALNQVPAAERDTVAFHEAAAAWSMALRQYGSAEKHFQEALALEPNNRRLRLNLATVRLALTPAGGSQALREELGALQKEPDLFLPATRALLADARGRGDKAGALKLAEALNGASGARTGDRLLYIEELQEAGSPVFGPKLELLRHDTTSAGGIYAVMEWMNNHGLAAKTIEWNAMLPTSIQAQLPEPLAVAEACTLKGDWKALRMLIKEANWGPVEFLRLAYVARLSAQETGRVHAAEAAGRWELAVNSTAGNANAIAMLARLAQSWGWKSQASELWWLIAKRNVGQRPALTALYDLAMADKNTRELYRVSRRILEVEGANPVAKNNVSMFALLLAEDLPDAEKIADEDYKSNPANSVFASTYAFSLYRQNRLQEAADVLAKLPAKELEDPSIGACYGVVLTELGEKEKAAPFLNAATQEKRRLFPEEIALVEKAQGFASQ